MKPFKPSKAEERAWAKWVASRPPAVREVAERFFPWRLYRIKSSGHVAVLRSFCEDGTLTVTMSAKYNNLLFERYVFGVPPDDLEECDPPDPSEMLGKPLLSHDEVEMNIDALRVMMRPDLWAMGEDGKAIRKS